MYNPPYESAVGCTKVGFKEMLSMEFFLLFQFGECLCFFCIGRLLIATNEDH